MGCLWLRTASLVVLIATNGRGRVGSLCGGGEHEGMRIPSSRELESAEPFGPTLATQSQAAIRPYLISLARTPVIVRSCVAARSWSPLPESKAASSLRSSSSVHG